MRPTQLRQLFQQVGVLAPQSVSGVGGGIVHPKAKHGSCHLSHHATPSALDLGTQIPLGIFVAPILRRARSMRVRLRLKVT